MQPAERDLYGEPTRDLSKSQLFTPMWIARRMATWIPRAARVCEPSCGTGNLIQGLVDAGHDRALIHGIELDERMVDFAHQRLPGVHIEACDFFRLAGSSGFFDAMLMNPPFEENAHLAFVLRALELAPVIVGIFPSDFEYTKQRDQELWATRGVVTRRAILPERVKFTGAGGQNEHVVLRIARRTQPRRAGEERRPFEETWRSDDVGPFEHFAEVP